MNRRLRQIVATTDVHSAIGSAAPMLAFLHTARTDSLIVDSGDFFEGTGIYRLGRGDIERDVLTTLYDVVAPGNHGWPHYFEPELRRITVCANTTDEEGVPIFERVRIERVGGRQVAVTAVIGQQAFHSIPVGQRAGHRVLDPVRALREVMIEHHHRADSWVVMSHSGFEEDLKLAGSCPFADVIFSGHCHSDAHGPVCVGDTLVVKGQELGLGYATAAPTENGWAARTDLFPNASTTSDALTGLRGRISGIEQKLARPLGTVREPYRDAPLDRRRLLEEIAGHLRTGFAADAVVLNETALRSVPLGRTLTLGDLLAVEPFDNALVHAVLPDEHNQVLNALTEHVGPLVVLPNPLPSNLRSILTTDYLADSHFGGRTSETGLRLGHTVRRLLTARSSECTSRPEGGRR
ncbi:bifunctional UDP-sugar hydrolase/5'-nucleotidase [Streptomyces jumonjinensis]|uniref:Bifunctional metallophosphatase/5'-nucleotidase n=1 Tax=Streptomyces jumonjinensis TaxID=1945 RepID=A0A646KL27_STRJU|nr:bifunctional metallophosphatase/5'-nucleotidase [Streptomyces jumonjinensis]MQT01746.1 bifunctional metallophosphatase/5'-nucleotidase [Streptomyces jumonjinensis]